jgi:hypothetical protein
MWLYGMMGSGESGTESIDGSEARKPDPAANSGFYCANGWACSLRVTELSFEGTIKPMSCSSSIVGQQTATELLVDCSLSPPYWLSG